MKKISMVMVGMGMMAAAAAQAGSLGNFGPYAKANSNEATHKGAQIVVPAEGRLNAYAPSSEVVKGHTQVVIGSEGRLNGYRS